MHILGSEIGRPMKPPMKPGKVKIGTDVAASEFYKADEKAGGACPNSCSDGIRSKTGECSVELKVEIHYDSL